MIAPSWSGESFWNIASSNSGDTRAATATPPVINSATESS